MALRKWLRHGERKVEVKVKIKTVSSFQPPENLDLNLSLNLISEEFYEHFS